MSRFIVEGGIPLKGTIRISGSKNSALPILAATLLTKKTCEIHNVPQILDIEVMIEILRKLGAEIEREGDKIRILTKNVKSYKPDPKLVNKLRASILLMGVLLARFGKVVISHPGGCLIGARPIDIHLKAFEELGAEILRRGNSYYLKASRLIGSRIIPRESSVTGTENVLMAASLASGKTTIRLAAQEPEVEDLANFLKKLGVKIKGEGTNQIEVWGTNINSFKGVKHSIIPDRIEAATFIIAGLVTGGKLTVKNINSNHLEAFLNKLKDIGVRLKIGSNFVTVFPSKNLKSCNVKTAAYPGFATDFQAPLSVLLLKARGKSVIFETIFEERLNYIQELVKMGAKAKILNPHEAEIIGPSHLRGTHLMTHDLRAGASLILAALSASGVSEIDGAEIIERGYEKIEQKLRFLGAKIKKVNGNKRDEN